MSLHRFLLTILPAPVLAAEVERLRTVLFDRIGSFSGRNNSPHITLCFLDLTEENEEVILEAITRGTAGRSAFDLHYHGITHFPDKRTIYIDPVEKDAIAAVRTPIVAALKADPSLHAAVRETDHPHLTIAAGLKPTQFMRAWVYLAPHECHRQEQVREVVLMRRELIPGARYEHLRTFPLA
ncbi:MAG: 2'-5' RNA ligase family protein [Flavobacteriales bacterium]|jgi:2'-5' RNA ligase|nr:2'-5' RNA ligase family protein [Flavobacteriales bacterium]